MKTHIHNLKIYLDTCCLSRPFNDQTQTRIRRETEAIQTLLKSCFTEQCFWITSDVLIFEVNNTPNQIQRNYMRTQLNRAYQNVSIGAIENIRGEELETLGFKAKNLKLWDLSGLMHCTLPVQKVARLMSSSQRMTG